MATSSSTHRAPSPPPPFQWPQAQVINFLLAKGFEQCASFHSSGLGQFRDAKTRTTYWDRDMASIQRQRPGLNEVEKVQKVLRLGARRAYGTKEANNIYTKQAYPWMHDKSFQPPMDWRPTGTLPSDVAQTLAEYQKQQEKYQQEMVQWRKDVAKNHVEKLSNPTNGSKNGEKSKFSTSNLKELRQVGGKGVEVSGTKEKCFKEADAFLATLDYLLEGNPKYWVTNQ